MKTVFKHIAVYFLVLLVMASSANVSINKMRCLLSGKIVYSFEEIEDCSPVKGENTIHQKCCDFQNATLDFEYQTLVKKASFGVHLIAIPFVDSFISGIKIPLFTSFANFYTNSFPPLSGFSLLKLIQVFRL